MDSNRRVSIRQALPADAHSVLELMRQLRRESPWLLPGEDEGIRTVEEQASFLERAEAQGVLLLLALDGGAPVAYLGATLGRFKKNRHCAQVSLAVLAAYRRLGIGRRLLRELDVWAVEKSVLRLELTVAVANLAAAELYRSSGYQVEGTRQRSFLLQGQLVDEMYMSKVRDPQTP